MQKAKVKDWNYRIYKSGDFYGIVEVYYDASGNPVGFSDYNYPFGYSEQELKLDISSMLKACRLPTLTEQDFEKNKKSVRKNKIVVPSVKSPPNREVMIKGHDNV
jgi:hypothetical protein